MANRGNDIIQPINHLSGITPKWFVIKTKFKGEKYVVANLKNKGIEAYIPIHSITKKYTRKVKKYDKPLLNCYVFVYITKEQYVRVLETEHVYSFVKQGNDLISIPERELNLLRKIVGEIEVLESRPINFEEGQQVEIVGGSLTGLKGTLLQKKSKRIFIVALDHIGIQLEMEVDKSLIEPVKSLKTAV